MPKRIGALGSVLVVLGAVHAVVDIVLAPQSSEPDGTASTPAHSPSTKNPRKHLRGHAFWQSLNENWVFWIRLALTMASVIFLFVTVFDDALGLANISSHAASAAKNDQQDSDDLLEIASSSMAVAGQVLLAGAGSLLALILAASSTVVSSFYPQWIGTRIVVAFLVSAFCGGVLWVLAETVKRDFGTHVDSLTLAVLIWVLAVPLVEELIAAEAHREARESTRPAA